MFDSGVRSVLHSVWMWEKLTVAWMEKQLVVRSVSGLVRLMVTPLVSAKALWLVGSTGSQLDLLKEGLTARWTVENLASKTACSSGRYSDLATALGSVSGLVGRRVTGWGRPMAELTVARWEAQILLESAKATDLASSWAKETVPSLEENWAVAKARKTAVTMDLCWDSQKVFAWVEWWACLTEKWRVIGLVCL